MITAYHRPKTLDEALTLLVQPNRVPLGGGTLLSHATPDPVEVVDLQSLGLDTIKRSGNNLEIGAAVTLQQLLENEHCPDALKTALKLEAPLNLRNAATVAGTLVSCDGRSTFATVMLALDAKINIVNRESRAGHRNSSDSQIPTPDSQIANIGEFLPLRPGGLITSVTIPLNVKLAFDYVSRTPADKPIVCAALAQWNSGRTRLALGGYGKTPMLAMDGTESDGIETAARNAFHEATDEWASAEYRMDIASTLAKRCLESL
ncbi:MAG: FAD binding domain-containing protein [Anaerolineales bacterium]